MAERPIIFSGESVRAILAGRKTQTRRVVRWPIVSNGIVFDRGLGDIVCRNDYLPPSEMLMDFRRGKEAYYIARCEGWEQVCPYGVPGDRLWVRETWQHENGSCDNPRCGQPTHIYHRATETYPESMRWRSPIHMPRWASRLTLRVTDVRVERLKDICASDIRAEGLVDQRHPTARVGDTPTLHTQFGRAWDDINAKRAPWASNPWVWVVTFEKEENGG